MICNSPIAAQNSSDEETANIDSGSDAPLTPGTLSEDSEEKLIISEDNFTEDVTSFPSDTSSSSPKKTIVEDAGDIDCLAESMLGLRKLEGKKAEKGLYKMLLGSMFAYVVLGIWIWTICEMLGVIRLLNCSEKFMLEAEGLPSDVSDCIHEFTGKLACAHSITFGLISAVVINETGSSDSETAMQRLSSIVKPISKRRQGNYQNANIFQRALCLVIVLLPAIYVITWTAFGLWCFVSSLAGQDGSSGPLFYTGQTWLGIIIRTSYMFFGVSDDSSPSKNEASHSHGAQKNSDIDEETGLVRKNSTQ